MPDDNFQLREAVKHTRCEQTKDVQTCFHVPSEHPPFQRCIIGSRVVAFILRFPIIARECRMDIENSVQLLRHCKHGPESFVIVEAPF